MENSEILQTIKKEAKKILPGCKVLLFGSRARQEYHHDSDYDILVITKRELSIVEKRKIRSRIRKSLHAFDILSDILVQTTTDIKNKMNLTGHIIKDAINEGIEL